MGRFSMAWASRLCELHQHSDSPVILTTSLWDPLSSRFSPPVHHSLPLPVDAKLLVAGVIHNFLHGESQIHAAVRRGSTLLVGCFDADSFNFEVLMEVELPDHEQQQTTHWAAEGCWLVDGPVFIMQISGKLVVVHSLACERSQCLDTSVDANQCDDRSWHAYVLNLEGVGDNIGVRTLYCGDLGFFEGSSLLLSLQLSSGDDFEAMPSCRFRAGWNFVRIPAGQFNSKDFCSSNKIWEPVPVENALVVCNDLFPSDVCLDLISCVGVIPRDPATAGSSLANPAHEAEEREDLSHDVIVGYWNGKIVKYRMGAVVAQIDLEDAPISFQFAVVADGQGVVLCILNGESSTVVALCAETLLLLKAWPESQDVVVGDFQMLGHDQLLLVSMPLESDTLSTTSVDGYSSPQQLTDLKMCYFSSSRQPSLPDWSGIRVEAHEVHKSESLNSIAQCLKSRMESGLAQMESMEEQRVEKAELLKSSCGLLQEMALKDASFHLLGESSSKFAPSDFVKTSIIKSGTCGRTWFLVVNVENMSQKDIILQDLSLSLTTIRGPISGSSSVVKSLCAGEKQKHLVSAVSLTDLPEASVYPIFHVLLNVRVCKANASGKYLTLTAADNPEDDSRTCYMHREWIGQIETTNVIMTGSLDPPAVPLDFREVAPKHTFMVNRRSTDQHMDVVNTIKAALKMEYRVGIQTPQVDAVHELVASRGALWSDTTIISAGETHMVILRAEDSKHLSALNASLAIMAEELELQIEAPYPEILNTALCFLKTLKEEIEHKKSLLQGSNQAVLHWNLKEMDDFRASVLRDCEMQMSTDRHFSSFLAGVMKTDAL